MSTDRDAQGRLVAGHTVRPLARPGSGKDTEAELIKRHLAPSKLKVLDKLAALAEAGDGKSMELFLRYFSPGARPEDERISVPGLAEAETLEGKAEAIVAAVSSGQISATAGERVLGLLEKLARVVVADEHERRLRALEQARGAITPSPPADVIDMNDLSSIA